MNRIRTLIITLLLTLFGCTGNAQQGSDKNNLTIATFAGGCFWCVEADFEKASTGIVKVISGYSGGTLANPTYKKVSAGGTGHLEVVQVHYDPNVISYDTLLELFWRQIDPTDDKGQFVDRGDSYRTAIFWHDEAQRAAAERSK